MPCFMKKEDESLIDVENVETTGERCCPLNSSLCTFIGMNHISPTFMYIIPMYLRLSTLCKTLPQMSFHLYSLLFLFRSGAPPMTLLAEGALTDPSCPRQVQTCVRMWQGRWRRQGAPPSKQKPGYPCVMNVARHCMSASIHLLDRECYASKH